MAEQLFTNNAKTTVTGTIAIGATSITLATGTGSEFPTITGSNYFIGKLFELDGGGLETRVENVKVTARTDDVLTIVRDFESMTGNAGGYSYPLAAGTIYFSLPYSAYAAGNTLKKDDNLAGLANAATARTNLGLGNVQNTSDADKPVSTAQATAIGLKETAANKDATGGYAGLTLFKINLKNAAGSITSWLTSVATVARTWTMPDKDGTVAMTIDLVATGIANTPSGNIAATTVQSAINELDAEKASLAGSASQAFSTAGLTVTGLLDASGAAAGQIKFPSTQNASANANTLDDYEEGTWTPAGAGLTLTVDHGVYTKIGRVVTVECKVTFPVNSDVTNVASITGLPFIIASEAAGACFGNGLNNFTTKLAAGSPTIVLLLSGTTVYNSSFSNKTLTVSATYIVS